MRAELFFIRRTPEESAELNLHLKPIAQVLSKKADAFIIYKTDVDRDSNRIIDALATSLNDDTPADIYIFLGGIDTEDSTSFLEVFGPLADELEEATGCRKDEIINGEVCQRHINIYSFDCDNTDNKGFCFYAADKRFVFLPTHTESDAPIVDFVVNGVNEANKLLNEKWKTCPDGTSYIEKSKCPAYVRKKPRGIKGFFMSFIPQRGDKPVNVILKIVVLLAITAFLIGGYLLLDYFVLAPAGNQAVMNEIQQIYYDDTDTEMVSTIDEAGNVVSVPLKNWSKLEKINKEIVSWIKLDGTKIDYPVLYHKGDTAETQYYLYRNYKKKYSDFGSIFVDYRCEKIADSKNYILHGHNMGTDDSMFGQLLNYTRKDGSTQGNTSYYKKAPIVTIDTPKGSEQYIIFSVIKLDVANENDNVLNYLKAEFDSDARFMNFVYNLKVRSYLKVDVPINEDDQLLTLSTCSYETQTMRTVAFARKIRQGEDVQGYIKGVKANKPVKLAKSTFLTELEKGKLKWYDGKGIPEGVEDIEYFEQSEMFIVKFLDANGKVISHQQVLKGRDAKKPKNEPRKKATTTHRYEFSGWDKSFTNVQKDLIIKPKFKAIKLTPVPTTTRATEPEEETKPNNPPATLEPKPTKPPATKPTQPDTTTQPPATTAPTTIPVETTAAQ